MFTLTELKKKSKSRVAICLELKRPQPKETMEDDDAWRGGGIVVVDGEMGGVGGFKMPVHYPKFTRAQYADTEGWRLDILLNQYGPAALRRKPAGEGKAAIGHFLCPEQPRLKADARRCRGDGEKGNVAGFKMPVHYPRFTRAQYADMEEWRLDNLLNQYGLPCAGSLEEKRTAAMGHFLWPEQPRPKADARQRNGDGEKGNVAGFKMPVNYPRFTRAQYAAMEEWQLDNLLKQYGLPCGGILEEKRKAAMGHFLWTSQD